MSAKPSIAILGGTGDLGSGLAKRWLAAGYSVVIGSRSAEKAQAFAKELGGGARGDDNVGAAKSADIVVLAVPFGSHDETLREVKDAVQGKIVVDAAVPLVPPKVSVVQLPPEGSAAQIAQTLLGEGVKVVSAFHNVGATKLHAGGRADCDVLVFGNDKESRDVVIGLANEVASAGIDGGVLANSAAAEALTSVLIGINRRYKVPGAGIRITGLSPPAPQ
ncbi:MAG TPA: NADPH-dependent F420 reductase [Afipia sp.]|nr:NADPH-dependent F420 reductase [Afipia sp.]OUX60536.1 MAG: NADPH-dependent F420 reductase [Afipia sp. TMED4]HAO39263.1 NADPH-dependent F420 reductase [Afipia sp.]HAP12475.1 NADPH-dependent F420 reductase [Afipia sp.]HAQ92805.1 NADPH-dependent F420 reductase [Afipia sp.]